MNNLIIIEARKREKDLQGKQAKFYKELAEIPRKEAKTLLLKQVDKAIEAIVELKADIVTNGITSNVFDCDFNETDSFFEPLQNTIGYIDFLINKEVERLLELSIFGEPDEAERLKKKIEKTDKEYNEKIKAIRTKEGTITLNY